METNMARRKKYGDWSVYMHIVPKEISGYDHDKFYIGITQRPVEERWANGHGYYQQVFGNAVKKYGWDNIIHKVVATDLIDYDAYDLERLLIFLYQSKIGKCGYNASDGGELSSLGYEMPEEIKQRISQEEKERWKNPEFREKMMPSRLRGGEHGCARKVILLNTLEEFDTIRDAASAYNVHYGSMGNYCAHKTMCPLKDEQGRHLIWFFFDEYLNTPQEELDRMLTFTKTSDFNDSKRDNPYVCLNNGDVVWYNRDLPIKYHAPYYNVQKCCEGQIKSAGYITLGVRLTWSYYSDYINMTEEEIESRIAAANFQGQGFRKEVQLVIDLFTNKLYLSTRTCSNDLNLSYTTVYKSIFDKMDKKHPCKNRFMYFKDFLKRESFSDIKIRETLVTYWTRLKKGEEVYYGNSNESFKGFNRDIECEIVSG